MFFRCFKTINHFRLCFRDSLRAEYVEFSVSFISIYFGTTFYFGIPTKWLFIRNYYCCNYKVKSLHKSPKLGTRLIIN